MVQASAEASTHHLLLLLWNGVGLGNILYLYSSLALEEEGGANIEIGVGHIGWFSTDVFSPWQSSNKFGFAHLA